VRCGLGWSVTRTARISPGGREVRTWTGGSLLDRPTSILVRCKMRGQRRRSLRRTLTRGGTVALSRRAAFRTATRQQIGDACGPKSTVSFAPEMAGVPGGGGSRYAAHHDSDGPERPAD
jgi:hypothetical protein